MNLILFYFISIYSLAVAIETCASSMAIDPRLMEEDPQFPQFTGRIEHVLAWITECQMRKEQRNLQDAVAIQYARMGTGETAADFLTDVRNFLGLCGFYQSFVDDYATVAAPLSDLMQKGNEWAWLPVQQPYVMHTDASDVAV